MNLFIKLKKAITISGIIVFIFSIALNLRYAHEFYNIDKIKLHPSVECQVNIGLDDVKIDSLDNMVKGKNRYR